MTPNRLAVAIRRLMQALPTVATAAFATAWAPTAQAYDLLQSFRDAYANDAPLASARANLAATGERVTQARAGLLPQLSGSAAINRTHAELQPAGAPTTINRNFTGQNIGLTLSQPLFRLQNYEAFQQSQLGVAQAEAAFTATELDLMVRVSEAYFNVLAAQDTLLTIRAQKRAIAEQLESAKRSFEVGTATITDQQEAQARFDLTTAQEAAAENSLAVTRSALQLLVGKPVGDLNALVRSVDLVAPLPATSDDWVTAARQANFNVQQSRLATEIAQREIRRAQAAELPTVDLVGQLARTNNQTAALIGTRITSAAVGLQLNLPIYQGGALTARVRETVALVSRAEADLENVRRQAEQAARSAFLGVASGLAQVRALEAGERSSQLALDSNLLGYQVGVRINIDVLNAQQQLFTTRRDLARARYDTLINGLRLRQAAGTLRADDLVAVNSLLGEPTPEPQLNLQQITPVPLQGGTTRGGAPAGTTGGTGAAAGGTPGATGTPGAAGTPGTGVAPGVTPRNGTPPGASPRNGAATAPGMQPRVQPGVQPGVGGGSGDASPGKAPTPPGARGNPLRVNPPVKAP